jgi:hypothetical protein
VDPPGRDLRPARLRLYPNGNEVASVPSGGRLRRSAGPLRIGGNAVGGDWFKGVIDEVRIYRRALSPKEIQRDMRRRVARPRATARAPGQPTP